MAQSASTVGGSATNASTLPSVDCSQPFGGNYLAGVTDNGMVATVTLSIDCTQSNYYLVVYTTSDNKVEFINSPSVLQTCSKTDPNSYCSFPSGNDFPQYLKHTDIFTNDSASVDLPDSCWQLDVVAAPADIPLTLKTVTGGPTPFVWGEVGPTNASYSPTTGPSPLTIGYWKNHRSAMSPLLPQTLGNDEVYTATEGVDVLSQPSAKYAENLLAAQLLAAELNLANHGPSCPALQNAITDANALLATIGYSGPPSSVIGPHSTYRNEANNDATTLVNYNQGTLC